MEDTSYSEADVDDIVHANVCEILVDLLDEHPEFEKLNVTELLASTHHPGDVMDPSEYPESYDEELAGFGPICDIIIHSFHLNETTTGHTPEAWFGHLMANIMEQLNISMEHVPAERIPTFKEYSALQRRYSL